MSDSDEIENDPKINIFRQCCKSPIDINVLNAKQIILPGLEWRNYEKIPQKMQLENSGETCIRLNISLVSLNVKKYFSVILMPEWHEGTPSLRGGPFQENYVLSRIHFHWGSAINGSEHTVDGVRYNYEHKTLEKALVLYSKCVKINLFIFICRMPLEMHAIHYKKEYPKLEVAKKYDNGLLILVYFLEV